MPEPAGLNGRQIIARWLGRTIVASALVTAVVYVADDLVLHYRIARNQSPYGTVTVRPYYAVPRKDHKVDLLFSDPEDDTCVNSLFSHFGDSPCWYLSRHKEKRVDL